MNSASGTAQPQPRMRAALVRLLPAGEVIRCGTVHEIKLERGQHVVIENALGPWLAECLDPQIAVTAGLQGELLRVASPTDQAAFERSIAASARLLETAAATLHAEDADVVCVAAEVDLAGNAGVIRFLGPASDRLGPLAVQLAESCRFKQVRWQPADQEQNLAPENTVHAVDPATEEAVAFYTALQHVTAAPPGGAPSLGKAHRIAAGNRGLYQQKRRGDSPAGRLLSAGRSWMVRVRTAGGGITIGQLLALLDLAETDGDGTLRLTMRQAIQLHGIRPAAPAQIAARLDQVLLQTTGSCGHSLRNGSACALPTDALDHEGRKLDPLAAPVRRLALDLQQTLMPFGPAYSLRFDGDGSAAGDPPAGSIQAPSGHGRIAEPLPHKFKIGVASEFHDCIDTRSNDLGFRVRGQPLGNQVDLFVGGGLAYRVAPRRGDAQLGRYLGTFPIDQAVAVAERLLRSFASRAARDEQGRPERFKQLVARTGIPALRQQLEVHFADRLDWHTEGPADPAPIRPHPDHGRTAGGRRWWRWQPPRGRIQSSDRGWLALLAENARDLQLRVGTEHDMILVSAEPLPEHPSGPLNAENRAASLPFRACPALPTCPQALAAAETVWEPWSRAVEVAAQRCGIEPPALAISGCPNGCARSLTAPIGLVAESPTRRAVFLGGSPNALGTRIGEISDPDQLADCLERHWKR